SLLEELRIQIEPHRGDMAMLLGPQEVAGPPDLEVAEGQLEPRPQLGELLDDLEPALGGLVQAPVRGDHQVGVGLHALPPHPPPGPEQLGPAGPVRPVGYYGV